MRTQGKDTTTICVGEVVRFHVHEGVAGKSPSGKVVVDPVKLQPMSRLGGNTCALVPTPAYLPEIWLKRVCQNVLAGPAGLRGEVCVPHSGRARMRALHRQCGYVNGAGTCRYGIPTTLFDLPRPDREAQNRVL